MVKAKSSRQTHSLERGGESRGSEENPWPSGVRVRVPPVAPSPRVDPCPGASAPHLQAWETAGSRSWIWIWLWRGNQRMKAGSYRDNTASPIADIARSAMKCLSAASASWRLPPALPQRKKILVQQEHSN
jgi:hypothetical protein